MQSIIWNRSIFFPTAWFLTDLLSFAYCSFLYQKSVSKLFDSKNAKRGQKCLFVCVSQFFAIISSGDSNKKRLYTYSLLFLLQDKRVYLHVLCTENVVINYSKNARVRREANNNKSILTSPVPSPVHRILRRILKLWVWIWT